MALHPNFPLSPYEVLPPDLRWVPTAEELRNTEYEKLPHPQPYIPEQEFEERWTGGGYIFENEWQSFCTRQNRDLEPVTAIHAYDRPDRYTVAVKAIDIFGNDTMTLVPVNVG